MTYIALIVIGVAVTPWIIRRVYHWVDSWDQAWAEDNRD